MEEVRAQLPQLIPAQVSKVLGLELSEKGLQTLHCMLQNELILKSFVYSVVDELLIEMFPEMKDHLGVEQYERILEDR